MAGSTRCCTLRSSVEELTFISHTYQAFEVSQISIYAFFLSWFLDFPYQCFDCLLICSILLIQFCRVLFYFLVLFLVALFAIKFRFNSHACLFLVFLFSLAPDHWYTTGFEFQVLIYTYIYSIVILALKLFFAHTLTSFLYFTPAYCEQ